VPFGRVVGGQPTLPGPTATETHGHESKTGSRYPGRSARFLQFGTSRLCSVKAVMPSLSLRARGPRASADQVDTTTQKGHEQSP
jgi:hypothetical protein